MRFTQSSVLETFSWSLYPVFPSSFWHLFSKVVNASGIRCQQRQVKKFICSALEFFVLVRWLKKRGGGHTSWSSNSLWGGFVAPHVPISVSFLFFLFFLGYNPAGKCFPIYWGHFPLLGNMPSWQSHDCSQKCTWSKTNHLSAFKGLIPTPMHPEWVWEG